MWSRPKKLNGQMLFFREDGADRIRVRDPENMLVQIRLYRWATAENVHRRLTADELLRELVPEDVPITKYRVGRILNNATLYDPKVQLWTKDRAFKYIGYTWANPLDLKYGVEAMIAEWYPEFALLVEPSRDPITTTEALLAELEELRQQSPEDDIEFFYHPAMELRERMSAQLRS